MRSITVALFFFFLINVNVINQEGKTRQSTLQVSKRTTSRLWLLKQNDWTELMESFVVAWATTLQSLLTQIKRLEVNDSLRTRILLIILLMTQSGWQSGEERELKQVLESPSIIIWSHLSSLAICAAHKMVDALAWSAGQN